MLPYGIHFINPTWGFEDTILCIAVYYAHQREKDLQLVRRCFWQGLKGIP